MDARLVYGAELGAILIMKTMCYTCVCCVCRVSVVSNKMIHFQYISSYHFYEK